MTYTYDEVFFMDGWDDRHGVGRDEDVFEEWEYEEEAYEMCDIFASELKYVGS